MSKTTPALTVEQAAFDALNSANQSRHSAEVNAEKIYSLMLRFGMISPQTSDSILINMGIDRKWCAILIDQSDAFSDMVISRDQARQLREITAGAFNTIHSRMQVNPTLNAIHRRCIGNA